MFGGLFKKRKPDFYLLEQPQTRVLTLPDKFKDNELTHQVFSLAERQKLVEIFQKKGADFRSYPMGDDIRFSAHILQMGEKFYAASNDLNDYPEEVREFEFFAAKR